MKGGQIICCLFLVGDYIHYKVKVTRDFYFNWKMLPDFFLFFQLKVERRISALIKVTYIYVLKNKIGENKQMKPLRQ